MWELVQLIRIPDPASCKCNLGRKDEDVLDSPVVQKRVHEEEAVDFIAPHTVAAVVARHGQGNQTQGKQAALAPGVGTPGKALAPIAPGKQGSATK